MLIRDDSWIERRILWALQKHRLPALHTVLYQAGTNQPLALTALAESRQLGTPVACCIGDETHWTLLGTRGIASSWGDGRAQIPTASVMRLRPSEPKKEGPREALIPGDRFLLAEDRAGQEHALWFPTEPELLAFWNILLRLSKAHR